MRSIGADHVIDYTREDFTRGEARFDVVLDIAGSRSWRELKRVLQPEARVIPIGGPKKNRLLGPLPHMAGTRLKAIRSSRTVMFFVAKITREDLNALRELIEDGKVKPVVEKRFALSELPEALRLMGEGHARGKLVISV